MSNILPTSISKAPHVAAFDEMFEKRLGDLPLDAALVYLIDNVSATVLPYLAEQFDVDGYKGYKLATNDTQRREIIKKAIELKRYMGTVYAVRQALNSVGYGSNAKIVEGVGTSGDPTQDWAVFRIEIDLGDNIGISGTLEDEATRLINEYKNARSKLESISYKSDLTDQLDTTPSDDMDLTLDSGGEVDALSYTINYYDGSWGYDSSTNYDESGNELITVYIL